MSVLVIEQDHGKIAIVYPAEGVPNDLAAGFQPFVELPKGAVPKTRQYRDGWRLSFDRTRIEEGVFEYSESGEPIKWTAV